MNKKNNRKGFTTVELVIVIAVIAILATVLIPTFSSLISKANESAALQEASALQKNFMIETAGTENEVADYFIHVGDYYFEVEDGKLNNKPVSEPKTAGDVIISKGTGDATYTKTVLPTT